MRVPAAGSPASEAARTVTHPLLPAFAALTGRTKLPTKIAPGARSTSSPGCAALSAACRSSPALTRSCLPVGAGTLVLGTACGSCGCVALLTLVGVDVGVAVGVAVGVLGVAGAVGVA